MLKYVRNTKTIIKKKIIIIQFLKHYFYSLRVFCLELEISIKNFFPTSTTYDDENCVKLSTILAWGQKMLST